MAHRGSTGDSLLLQIFIGVVWPSRGLKLSQHVVSFESSSLILHGPFRDSWFNDTMQTEKLTKWSGPLQKLGARLGTRLTGLSPPLPVILNYLPVKAYMYMAATYWVLTSHASSPSVLLLNIHVSLDFSID